MSNSKSDEKEIRDRAFEKIQTLLRGHRYSSLMFAAFDLGILPALSRQEMTPEALCKTLSLSRRGLLQILTALKAVELVAEEKGFFFVPDPYASCFNSDSEDYMGSLIRHEKHFTERWSRLAESVRSGKPVKNTKIKRHKTDSERFINAMAATGQKSAGAVLQKIGLRGDEHLLDLGGGPGRYQKIFCETYLQLKVTLFDLAETIQAAQDTLKNHPRYSQMRFIPGDMLTDEIGSGYDVILISNVIHIYGPNEIDIILKKCYEALKPGGRLLVKDFFMRPDDKGLEFSALFSLHMLLST
ncbi:MAG: methyltransferase, partial [Calditrichales bacterium]